MYVIRINIVIQHCPYLYLCAEIWGNCSWSMFFRSLSHLKLTCVHEAFMETNWDVLQIIVIDKTIMFIVRFWHDLRLWLKRFSSYFNIHVHTCCFKHRRHEMWIQTRFLSWGYRVKQIVKLWDNKLELSTCTECCTVGPRLSGHQLSGYLYYPAMFLQYIVYFQLKVLLKKEKVVKYLFYFIVYPFYMNDNLLQIE